VSAPLHRGKFCLRKAREYRDYGQRVGDILRSGNVSVLQSNIRYCSRRRGHVHEIVVDLCRSTDNDRELLGVCLMAPNYGKKND